MHTMITTSDELLTRLVAAARCGKCKGSRVNRIGTKECTACRGKGIADLNHPRIRFNGGFHDATLEHGFGKVREVSASDAGGWFYAAGYAAGLAAVKDGAKRPSSSEPAWSTLVAPIAARTEYTRAMGEWL